VPMAVEERPFRLRRSLAFLGRRKWFVLAVTVVVVAGALAYSLLQPPVYESQTAVLVRPISLIPTQPSDVTTVNMTVERRVATSAEIRERAKAKLDRAGVAVGEVAVDVAPADFTLQFTATAQEPAAARRTAEAFADSYLELRRREALEDLAAARKPIQMEIDANQRQLRAVQGQLAAAQQEAQRAALQAELNSLLAEQGSFKQSINRLVLPADLRVGQVLQPATQPRSPSSPDYPETGALALLVGLVLGVGLAFLRDRLDQRVRSSEELEALAPAPVLAVVPRAGHRLERTEHQGSAGPQPDGEVAEAYEALSREVLAITSQSAQKFLMVTGADGHEAKTAVTASLGAALAKADKRVVILGSERWSGRLGRFFHLPEGWAAGQHESPPNTATTDLQSLLARCWILPDSLLLLPLPGDFDLDADAWRELKVWLEESADVIVADGAPIPEMVRDSTLVSVTDGVLMAVDGERATRASVREASNKLDHLGLATVGTVLVTNRRARVHGRDGRRRELDAEQPAGQAAAVAAEGDAWPVGPEALRSVDAQVLHFPQSHAPALPGQSDPPLVVVTGDRRKEGKAAVAADLALTLAKAGKHIALVDLDQRRPAQRRVLDLLDEEGFAKAAPDGTSLERVMSRFTPVEAEPGRSGPAPGSVEVLTAPLDAEDVIAGPTGRVLDLTRERVDVVLVNVPPVQRGDDALSLLPAVDALVVASRRNRVRNRLLHGLRPVIDEPALPSVSATVEAPGAQPQEAGARRPLAARGVDLWLVGLMAIGGALALLLAFPDLRAVVQPAAALLFVGFVPGAAFVGLMRSMDLPVKLIASIALSLVINAVTAQALIWSNAWSPRAGFAVVAALSVIGFALQGLRRLRR
jgi:Mrp family chromosome partitioning ATPase/capsular polysaccharide biosynthesis protein